MVIQENISAVMRALKQQRGVSSAVFSEELEISRSTLQEYLNGTGNPRVDTIEHLAGRLGIDPVVLVSGVFCPSQLQVALLLLHTLDVTARLEPTKQQRMGELLVEMLSFWQPDEAH